jgi:hypothetical protein
MQSEPPRPSRTESPLEEEDDAIERESRPRTVAQRSERFSGDCIWLSPRAQRRMSLGRRTRF